MKERESIHVNVAKDIKDVKNVNGLKMTRQEAILNLIENEKIATQNELSNRLEEEGFAVTQATISRDIKELRLVKVSNADGSYHYEVGKSNERFQSSSKFYSIFMASVIQIDSVNNMVVIKCYTGMAQAVCETMDNLDWPGIVGTLAGDNTILIVTRNDESARELVQILKEIK